MMPKSELRNRSLYDKYRALVETARATPIQESKGNIVQGIANELLSLAPTIEDAKALAKLTVDYPKILGPYFRKGISLGDLRKMALDVSDVVYNHPIAALLPTPVGMKGAGKLGESIASHVGDTIARKVGLHGEMYLRSLMHLGEKKNFPPEIRQEVKKALDDYAEGYGFRNIKNLINAENSPAHTFGDLSIEPGSTGHAAARVLALYPELKNTKAIYLEPTSDLYLPTDIKYEVGSSFGKAFFTPEELIDEYKFYFTSPDDLTKLGKEFIVHLKNKGFRREIKSGEMPWNITNSFPEILGTRVGGSYGVRMKYLNE